MEGVKRPDFLIVEDDDDDFFLVQELLHEELESYAEQAHSVDDALERMSARDYDLILLDYTLGTKNGLDLLQELRARDNLTPVIFLTGHGDEQLAVTALKGGAVDYLSKKKMSRDSLSAAVRHALALSERDAAVRQARDALSRREREYRTLFEKANDAILIIDPDTEIVLEANPAACRLYQCDRLQLLGRSLLEFSTDIVRGRRAIEQCLAGGELANFETDHITDAQRRMHILVNASVIDYRGRTAILTLGRDISERKAAEQEIFRLNRALKALSKCNQALLGARDPQQFLDQICNIMVQVGGYRMAWVAGAPHHPDERIRPLASAGSDRDYVDVVCRRYESIPESTLLVPTAMRTGAPAVCRDASTGPADTQKECADRGFASIIALPLSVDGRIFGALAVYSGERDAFDQAEVDLLTELAGNVSFGLESIEARDQREQAQAELKAGEARLRNLIATANEGICTIDREGRVTLVNDALAEMLGGVAAEMLGRSVFDFFAPDRREAARARISAISDTSSARVRQESVLQRVDGKRLIVNISTSPIVDSEGSFAGLLAMLNDITEQKMAAESLQTSEQRLRNMIETAAEGIWIIDASARTTFVNAKMAAMLGRSPEEMLGRPIQEFDDPNYQFASSTVEQRATEREQYEVFLIHRDGRRIVTRLNSSAIFDAKGNYAGAMGMFTDITEQKQAEERLRESERRYRTLFERNLAGVFRAAADGTVLEANEAFLHMLGYDSAEEMQGLNLPQMCAAAGCAERWHEKLMSSGPLVNQEISVLRKDGGTAYLLANLVMLADAADRPEFLEGTVLDVSEHRQLQAQLLHSQKMDAIGQLAGGIAHDFNNLLMVVRSYAEMASEAIGDATVKRQMENIVKAADRGAVLTRQLLTFGRKQAFSPRMVELNGVLENLMKALPRALGEDVCVELHTAAALWQVRADPVQIEQMVLNLAVNARDAMPSGGRLTIETANTVLDAGYVKMHAGVVPGEYVMVAVSDTGHGISPEVLPRIFEPFFTTKERGKGTGLGLATVYGIVQQCSGYVWVYSEMGQGTVFKIYLPRAGAAAPAHSLQSQERQGCAAQSVGSETILLVEDEEAVRCATRDYLRGRGYQVLEAAAGDEALRVSDAHQGEIELLITDAVMPGMSGITLSKKMVERRAAIRVLCVSGYTEASMSSQGLPASFAFLQKPFSLAALAAKVRELLDSRASSSATLQAACEPNVA